MSPATHILTAKARIDAARSILDEVIVRESIRRNDLESVQVHLRAALILTMTLEEHLKDPTRQPLGTPGTKPRDPESTNGGKAA